MKNELISHLQFLIQQAPFLYPQDIMHLTKMWLLPTVLDKCMSLHRGEKQDVFARHASAGSIHM